MITVVPFVVQAAGKSFAESALPNAAVVADDQPTRFAALVSRALHRH